MEDFNKLPSTLSVKDVEEYLQISRVTAYSLFHREDFPSIKLSEGKLCIPKDLFKRWLEQQSGFKIEDNQTHSEEE